MLKHLVMMHFIVLIMLALARPARADDAPARPAINPVQIVKYVRTAVESLDLTDDQKPKIQAVFDKADQDASDLQDKIKDLDPADKLEQVTQFRKDLRAELTGVLTPEQLRLLVQKLSAGRGGGGGGGRELALLKQSLAKLNLSADQQKQVDDLLDQTQQQGIELREKAAAGQDVTDDLQKLRESVWQKLQEILTPEQQQNLTDLTQDARDDMARGDTDNTMQSKPGQDSSSKPLIATTKPSGENFSAVSGPDIGQPVPDLHLTETNGRLFQISKYKGHVIVLEFGSWSCPTFRDRAAEMEKLKSEIGPRAFLVLVYTREAHPESENQIPRNADDNIHIDQPATLDARRALAERAAVTLRITLPIIVDTMDDAAVKTFGGFPNGCVVIAKDGTISARQRRVDPDVLKRQIDEANK